MEESEIPVLLLAAEGGELHHGLSGHERALVYRLALETGLRWNEVFTRQRGDFVLGTSPHVIIAAQDAKNRKPDTLPISDELAADLSAYFATSPALPKAKAFAGMWEHKGGDMLAEDLAIVGIPVRNEAGEVLDFHSLRHTCGTRLARAGSRLRLP